MEIKHNFPLLRKSNFHNESISLQRTYFGQFIAALCGVAVGVAVPIDVRRRQRRLQIASTKTKTITLHKSSSRSVVAIHSEAEQQKSLPGLNLSLIRAN